MPQGRFIAIRPFPQKPQGGEIPIPGNHESVRRRLHWTTLFPAGEFRKLARTVKGRERFPFKITIVSPDQPAPREPWIGTHRWKHRAIYNMKMKLSIQIEKASNKSRYQWYKLYSVRGYGAPGNSEFICPYSGMVAKTVDPEEAVSLRKYWACCARKSKEILDWLDQLDPARYSADLNSYLLRVIVATGNIREITKYQKHHPFQEAKSWQKL